MILCAMSSHIAYRKHPVNLPEEPFGVALNFNYVFLDQTDVLGLPLGNTHIW